MSKESNVHVHYIMLLVPNEWNGIESNVLKCAKYELHLLKESKGISVLIVYNVHIKNVLTSA